MKIKIIESGLSLFYDKAKKNFEECIQDMDNKFLEGEVTVSLEGIVIVEKEIKNCIL